MLLDRLARRVWYGPPLPRVVSAALAAPELLYRGVLRGREAALGAARRVRSPLPVISVGNLSVGGTGKTPIIGWLGRKLESLGLRPGVLARGAGEDELGLYRTWLGEERVVARKDRERALEGLSRRGWDVVVLDDGFQRIRIHRELNLLLISTDDDPPKGKRLSLLPRGPYREDIVAARRATHVILTCKLKSRKRALAWKTLIERVAPNAPLSLARFLPAGWRRVDGGASEAPQEPVLAATAIARPDIFLKLLRRLLPHRTVDLMAFPDHHRFRTRDLRAVESRLGGGLIAATEKDEAWLRRSSVLAQRARLLALRVEVPRDAPIRGALRAFAEERRARAGP